MESQSYFNKRNEENILKLRELRKELPTFCFDFFRGIEPYTTPLTRIGYARDLLTFFRFLTTEVSQFYGRATTDFDISDLNKITSSHLEMFMEYLSLYKYNGKVIRNGDKSRSRKLSSIKSMLNYFFKKDKLDSNIATKIDTPKIRESEIIRFEHNEMIDFLNVVSSADNMTKMQQGFHKHTKLRDEAMMKLFLGTGIRISECVGLDIEDLDFKQNAFTVTRKGGSRVILYFNDEVSESLQEYLQKDRLVNSAVPKSERALFLSIQNKRIGVRAVEKLVKKYSAVVTPLKHITPHKLRSTFGTNLYRSTNDIYVVASVLGHKDVNTTRKHYAAITDDIRRSAATKVKLTENSGS